MQNPSRGAGRWGLQPVGQSLRCWSGGSLARPHFRPRHVIPTNASRATVTIPPIRNNSSPSLTIYHNITYAVGLAGRCSWLVRGLPRRVALGWNAGPGRAYSAAMEQGTAR